MPQGKFVTHLLYIINSDISSPLALKTQLISNKVFPEVRNSKLSLIIV